MSLNRILSILIIMIVMSAAAAQARVTVSLEAEKSPAGEACGREFFVTGKINTDAPGRIQYRFVRSDGVLQPIETMEFDAAGSQAVGFKWTPDAAAPADFKGWISLQVVYPEEVESNRAEFSVTCYPRHSDLGIKIRSCPGHVRPGGDLKTIKVRAFNHGGLDVKDALVELTLRKDSACPVPARKAERSTRFVSGMLIQGGREKVSIRAGQKSDIKFAGPHIIPADTPLGDYFLCASIDAEDNIKESNEANNCYCCPIKVAPLQQKPDLVIDRFSFRGWGKCEPGSAVATFEVTVKNVGHAASRAFPHKVVLQVTDMADRHWSSGSGLDSIPAGGTQTVVIPVYYYEANPAHMTNVTPHPFRAIIDPHNLLEESSRKNNRSDIIYLDLNAVCGRDE
jgi:hypothetical protein